MSVLTQHPDYTIASERWKLIRAIVNNNAKNYIRTPDINDPVRSEQYKSDALLTNFTNLTRVGLTGLVFRKRPEITLPIGLNYLFDDFTGSGINIWQFSQHSIGELLQMGRYGFLADKSEGGNTYVKPYIAENITNWKTKVVGGKCILSLVVLREYLLSEDNLFSQDMVKQYRVLFLDENGVYQQEVYQYKENNNMLNDGYTITESYTPLDYNGNVFSYIPFVFGGSQNNDWYVDPEPLYDLALVNLAHYRCSADLMESVWLNGQPFVHVDIGENSSKEDFDAANPSGVKFGSRSGLVTSGGNVQLLQCNANQMVSEVMKDLIEQASGIGARIIQPVGSSRETAEAAKIRYGAQHSSLYTLTSNFSWAMENVLSMVAEFEGVNSSEISFKLNDEFYDELADANVIAQIILSSDKGIIAKDDVRDYLRRVGIVSEDRTNQEIQLESSIPAQAGQMPTELA